MASINHELELETQIAMWQSSRHIDGLKEFIPRRRNIHIEMRISGLVWSIEALPLSNTAHYTFNIIEVKRSESPFDLPAKFKFLVVALQMYIRSVFRVEKLLDKLYACSRLLYQAENEKRWWIVVDAEITAVACKMKREATQQAAEAAAAAFHGELMEPLECYPRHNVITDELWTTRFPASERWNSIARAVYAGHVLQWCKVQVLESDNMIHCFEFEVTVHDFLQGNGEISRIGVVNTQLLKVTVDLKGDISVACSQEGVETGTSLGLGSLLPYLIRNYITTALERNECEHGVNNVVQGLVQNVIGYLTFLPRVCVVCGSHRFLESSLITTCSYLCEARKDMLRDGLALTWATDYLWRRQQYATNSLRNMEAAQQRLSTLLLTDDVEMGEA